VDQPLSSVTQPEKDTLYDIWDGSVIRNFVGPDKKPFFQYAGPEGRLLFGFGYDNTNPFHNMAAGKVASVGAIFLFCYNLDPDIWLKYENVYLAGVVNGPKAPSLTESNHYIRPLIDQFEVFWSRGYHFTETPSHLDGRIVRGVIIPMIMDLHALRQLIGAGTFTAKFFCTFCLLQHRDIDNVDPRQWPPNRTCAEHQLLAQEWLTAPSLVEREKLFKDCSLRWTEFLRLEYWHLSVCAVIDPMHAWMNIFRNLVRNTWGVDHKHKSGNGLFVGVHPKSKRPVTPKELVNVLEALSSNDWKTLEKASKRVLYHLCEARELRCADNCHQMRVSLKQYYVGWFIASGYHLLTYIIGSKSLTFKR
jgi:Transposase family tnp2